MRHPKRYFGLIVVAGLLLLKFSIAVATDSAPDLAEIKLTSTLEVGKAVTVAIPRSYLAARDAHAVKNGRGTTDSLHLILRYTGSDGSLTVPSPRDIRRGTPDLVHAFLKVPIHPHQKDVGKWYLERFLTEAKGKGQHLEQQRLDDRLRKYGGPGDEIYTYVDDSSQTIVVRCHVAICSGYRTWRGLVRVEYRYDKSLIKQLAAIDKLLDEVLRKSYRPQ